MKYFLLLAVSFIVLPGALFCQCPQPGLKIQSAACEQPQNLKAHSITCSELKVNWTGNKDQTYVVKASGTDPATNGVIELKISKSKCDSNGNCEAIIPVKEGFNITWSVQSVCTIENASLFSGEARGDDVYISHCQELKKSLSIKPLRFNIYPNPSAGTLFVEYPDKAEGDVEFRVYDVSGKQVFFNSENHLVKTNNRYKLNLKNLPPGTYMLEIANGGKVNRSKFVLMKK